jgi:release factor glutamine methyltransferase
MLIKDFVKEQNGIYILEKVLKKDKTWIFLNDNFEVPKEAIEILKKVKNGYPIEYIFKEVWFYSDKFYITEGVLIPRDDTEIIVERAIKLINKLCKSDCTVIDCCTGSGVIAIEIAKYTKSKVIATDISDIAITVAKKNILLNGVKDRVEVLKCDLLECDFIGKNNEKNSKGDILIANPPYVENSWKKPNKYEPDLAFYGGEDGLDIIRKLIFQAKNLGFKAAIIEIGFNQKEKLSEFLNKVVKSYNFFNDLSGNVRGVEIFFN